MRLRNDFLVNLVLYFGLLLLLSSAVYCTCPSRKTSRRNQITKLETLTSTDVVAEALYQGKIRGYHKFVVEQVWMRNNGSLQREDFIYVDTASGALYQDCFRKLFAEESYMLMLTLSDEAYKIFRPLEAPVFSSQKKLRRAIFNSLCAPPGKSANSCKMKITLPKRVAYYQDQKQSIVCKVDSLSPVTEVHWFKDNTEIHSNVKAGLTLNTDEKDYSVLSFDRISSIHTGSYKCLAANQAGQHAFAEVRIDVVGPLSLTHFQPCDQSDYCFNGGLCRQMFNGKKSCECSKSFYGGRCENVVVVDSQKDNNVIEMKMTLSHLTTALTAVSITLFFVLILSLTYILRTKNKQNPDRDMYDGAEQISMQEIPPESTNIPSNFGSLLLEEAATPVRIFVEDSQHTIEILPSPMPSRKEQSTSDQYLSVVHHQNITPKSPLRSLKSCNDKSSFSTPVSPCPSASSTYSFTRRERLNGKSFS